MRFSSILQIFFILLIAAPFSARAGAGEEQGADGYVAGPMVKKELVHLGLKRQVRTGARMSNPPRVCGEKRRTLRALEQRERELTLELSRIANNQRNAERAFQTANRMSRTADQEYNEKRDTVKGLEGALRAISSRLRFARAGERQRLLRRERNIERMLPGARAELRRAERNRNQKREALTRARSSRNALAEDVAEQESAVMEVRMIIRSRRVAYTNCM